MAKKKFVFGLGAGRCGTSSLAFLLNSQNNAFVGHELAPTLPWKYYNEGIRYRYDQLNHQSALYDLVGDVSFYYLPYVVNLMNMSKINLSQTHDFKFIILKRERSAVVKSFLHKFKIQGNNPLQSIKAIGVKPDEWDDCFPTYDKVDLQTSIEMYYDDYYKESEALEDRWNDDIRIFDVDVLNTSEGVMRLLGFIGVENPIIIVGIRKNQGLK